VGALLLGGFGDNKTKKIQKCKNVQNVVKRLNALFQKTDFVRDFFFEKKFGLKKILGSCFFYTSNNDSHRSLA